MVDALLQRNQGAGNVYVTYLMEFSVMVLRSADFE